MKQLLDKLKQKISHFRTIIEKNKKIVLIISILVIILSAAVIIYSSSDLSNETEDDLKISQNTESKDKVDFLPVQKRDNEESRTEDQDTENGDVENSEELESLQEEQNFDPFAGPITLNGVIVGGKGDNAAVIDVGNSTYVVKQGDSILDYWTIKEIKEDYIILESDSITHKVTL